MVDIDYSAVPTTTPTQTPWTKAPKHVYFGKRTESGEMEAEPAYTYAPYPAFRYAKSGAGFKAVIVANQEESDALGPDWVDTVAKFGAYTAPSFEQMQETKAKKK